MWLEQVKNLWLTRPFHSSAPLVVGVSGGLDSMVLLHLFLHHLSPAGPLYAVHVQHGLRPEAPQEGEFVQTTLQKWGVRCELVQVDTPQTAQAHNLSLEAAARRVRYQQLGQVARQVGAEAVAVAHHGRDQAETVLLHLLRGTGLQGLQGMKPFAPLPEQDPTAAPLWLARPLVGVNRAFLEQYVAENNIPFVVDSSNFDPTFTRNRLRQALWPVLHAFNPQLEQALGQLGQLVQADQQFLQEVLAEKWPTLVLFSSPAALVLDLAQWQKLPLSLRRLSVRQAFAQLKGHTQNLGFERVEQARLLLEAGLVGQKTPLGQGVLLEVGYGQFLVTTNPAAGWPSEGQPLLPEKTDLELLVPGRVAWGEWQLEASRVVEPGPAAGRWEVFVQTSSLELTVRGRRPGEKFRPRGLQGHHTKLKKWFIDHKLPASWRDQWPLVADEQGVLWVVGYHPAEREAGERVRLQLKKERE